MKVRASYVLVLAALSLAACSKKEGSDNNGQGRLDVTRYQVESLSDENEITNSDYDARIKALKVKSKVCRTSSFGTLKKGDQFVENFRAGALMKDQVSTYDVVLKTQVVSVDKKVMLTSSAIESAKSSDANLETRLKQLGKFSSKCKAGQSCVSSKTGLEGELKKFHKFGDDCKFNNEREVTLKYATGSYLLQDGRKVPVVIARTQATYDRVCKEVSDIVILSSVNLKTDGLKRADGKECVDAEPVTAYKYSLLQKTSGELISEYNARTLLAPGK